MCWILEDRKYSSLHTGSSLRQRPCMWSCITLLTPRPTSEYSITCVFIFYFPVIFFSNQHNKIDFITRHWIQQIQAVMGNNDQPILVVGTHADKILSKKEPPQQQMQEVITRLGLVNQQEIKGFFPVSLSSGLGLEEFKKSLVTLAMTHPQIGIMKAKIPYPLMSMQKYIQSVVHQNKEKGMQNIGQEKTTTYIDWKEYTRWCLQRSITLFQNQQPFEFH